MKISNKSKPLITCAYGEIKQGAVFKVIDCLYIKTDALGISGTSCIRLDTGCTYSLASHTPVNPVDAEVVVYD